MNTFTKPKTKNIFNFKSFFFFFLQSLQSHTSRQLIILPNTIHTIMSKKTIRQKSLFITEQEFTLFDHNKVWYWHSIFPYCTLQIPAGHWHLCLFRTICKHIETTLRAAIRRCVVNPPHCLPCLKQLLWCYGTQLVAAQQLMLMIRMCKKHYNND